MYFVKKCTRRHTCRTQTHIHTDTSSNGVATQIISSLYFTYTHFSYPWSRFFHKLYREKSIQDLTIIRKKLFTFKYFHSCTTCATFIITIIIQKKKHNKSTHVKIEGHARNQSCGRGDAKNHATKISPF